VSFLGSRVFWLVAFLIGVGAAAILIYDVWEKYRDNPVIVSFSPRELDIEFIPFPAVTICNMNKILNREAMKILA
jgi:hypothetical protein